ncbi:hypothetical protein GCM10017691_56950 [Pseudonocardia petroleophila]
MLGQEALGGLLALPLRGDEVPEPLRGAGGEDGPVLADEVGGRERAGGDDAVLVGDPAPGPGSQHPGDRAGEVPGQGPEADES